MEKVAGSPREVWAEALALRERRLNHLRTADVGPKGHYRPNCSLHHRKTKAAVVLEGGGEERVDLSAGWVVHPLRAGRE